MRARTNISLKERRQMRLSGFLGVDLTSNPLEVSASRATFMRNFINDGGVNHKRPGWRELIRLDGKINGIFEYTDGDIRQTIVQSGIRFYRIELRNSRHIAVDITETCTYPSAAIDTSALDPDSRSQGFMLNGALYIIGCGDFLVYEHYESSGAWELRRVFDNEGTTVPTTTARATGRYKRKDPVYTSLTDEVFAEGGVMLDDVNMLSSKRSNSFIGYATKVRDEPSGEEPGEEESEEGIVENTSNTVVVAVHYTVDGDITENTLVEIVAEHGGFISGGYVYSDGTLFIEGTRLPNGKYSPDLTIGSGLEGEDKSLEHVLITRRPGIYTIRNSEEDYESLYEIGEDGSRVKVGRIDGHNVYLYSLYNPPMEGLSNITVTFTPSGVENMSKRISKCSFGTRFGTEKVADRLFLGGNSEYKNIDFHSEESDFTYFGELSTAALGDGSTAIVGYGRLSDSSLVVYKGESNYEPAFFYRTAKYYDEYDAAGNLQQMRGIFPHTEGAVGEGVVSRYANANLCGDVISLSRSGVHGIVLSENMMTTERYMRERSKSIRSALAGYRELSDAIGVVYKNRYYLAIDGLCYVADARLKYSAHDDIDGSYNYEWFVWDNIPARVWGKLGDELYFGTADGRVCVFDDEYTDRSCEYTEAGDLAISADGDVIYNGLSENLSKLREGDRLTFLTDGVYALIDDPRRVTKGVVYTSDEALTSIFEGMTVFAGDGAEDCGLSTHKAYTVGDIDRHTASYRLFDNGEAVSPRVSGFKLYVSVSGKPLYIADDPRDCRFAVREHREGGVLRLAVYESAVLSPLAIIDRRQNVVSEWVTPVFDLGTNVYSKTLTGMTVSVQPVKKGKLSFGYETRRAERMLSAKGINVFSLEDLSFNDFTFDTGFQNSYSVRCNERNFNYIVFRFISDSDTDCAINDFTIDYKINKLNKGVR